MKFETCSHRFGLEIAELPEHQIEWREIQEVIHSITDEEIKNIHNEKFSKQKSISKALNHLFRKKFESMGWTKEAPIFQDRFYTHNPDTNKAYAAWRLDFSKRDFSVEVAFNHGGDLAWNFLKPVLASELNHVAKAIQTKIGVLILATKDLKTRGGFDGAIGEFEKAQRYLDPLRTQLTCPTIIIGLCAAETFEVEHIMVEGKKRAKFIKCNY